jgi:choline dehydrogenase
MASSNINAPSMMIGERAADLILGVPLLPPENAPFHRPLQPTDDETASPIV